MDGGDITFAEVMDLIDKYYESQILEFKNGDIVNQPGENEGSAKVFSYAALSELDKESTLKLFGEHYRSVKANPDGDDHQNIRNFMKYGWEGRWQIETTRFDTTIHVPRVCLTHHVHVHTYMYQPTGLPFENGIALTRKNVGENEWDWDA